MTQEVPQNMLNFPRKLPPCVVWLWVSQLFIFRNGECRDLFSEGPSYCVPQRGSLSYCLDLDIPDKNNRSPPTQSVQSTRIDLLKHPRSQVTDNDNRPWTGTPCILSTYYWDLIPSGNSPYQYYTWISRWDPFFNWSGVGPGLLT